MKRTRHMAFILIPWVSLAPSAESVPPADEYAYTFDIHVERAAEVVEAELTTDFYRSVTDPSLRDAGVYNADGQPVPRQFTGPQHGEPKEVRDPSLVLVPVTGPPDQPADRLRLLMRQEGRDTTVTLDAAATTSDSGPGTGQRLTAYLVDLGEDAEALDYLELSWPASQQGLMGRVSLHDSDALQGWRRVDQATIADLAWDDTRILRNRLRLGRDTARYLRITWSGLPDSFSLDGISGIRLERENHVRHDWLELEPAAVIEPGREYHFDAGAVPPFDRARVLLSGENAVLRATLQYRYDADAPWRPAHQGVFFHVLRDGLEVSSDAAAFTPTSAPHWRLLVDAGTVTAPPRLALGWPVGRLRFVAQGPGPYQLVAGRGRDRIEGFPQQARLGDPALFGLLPDDAPAGDARLAARTVNAGPEALQVNVRPLGRLVLLWAGLVGAVLLVAWLVWSLFRESK